MNEYSIVQIISLLGFLILAVSAFASWGLNWGKVLRMSLIWAAVFVGMVLIFSIVAPQ